MGDSHTIFLLFLICLHGFSGVQGLNNCSGLSVVDGNGEEIDVNCTLLTTSSCSDPNNIPSDLAGSDPPSFVGKPNFFDAVSDREFRNGYYVPRMNVTWRPALSGSDLRDLKGFVVYMDPIAPDNNQLCRVFNLSGNHFSSVKITFNFLLGRMRQSSLYLVQLYSLPWPNEIDLRRNVRQYGFVYTQPRTGNNYEDQPKDWKTSIAFQMKEELGVINATFILAPDILNFTEYEVNLLNGSDPAFLTSVMTKKVSHSDLLYGRIGFEDIPTGLYSVSVQAVDTFFNDRRKCLCYYTTIDQERACGQCIVSRTPPFDFTNKMPSPIPTPTTKRPSTGVNPPTGQPGSSSSTDKFSSNQPTGSLIQPQHDDSTWKKVLAAVSGIILAAVLLVIIVILGWHRRQKCRRDVYALSESAQGNVNNGATVPKRNNAARMIFLVFAEDHDAHVEAVGSLARYLRDLCQCKVAFAPWCTHDIQALGMMRWVMEMLRESDFILVVNSEAAYHLGQAWRGSKSTEQLRPSPTQDLFITAFSRLCAKLVDSQSLRNVLTTRFDHTTPDYVLEEISQGIRYTLPTHLTDLAKVILHPKEPGEPLPKIPAAPHYMLESIKKAATYEKNFPVWFSKHFRVDPAPLLVQRLDSGIDSLPRESESGPGNENNHLGLDPNLDPDGHWYHNIIDDDDDCRTYYPSELDSPSIYTYGARNLEGMQDAEERVGEYPLGHLHVDMEGENPGVFCLPNTGRFSPLPASLQGSRGLPPSVQQQQQQQQQQMPTSQQEADWAHSNLQGTSSQEVFIPPVGFSADDISHQFHPPPDPEMLDGTSISPSEGLRRINMNSDRDWEVVADNIGWDLGRDWDASSGKSV